MSSRCGQGVTGAILMLLVASVLWGTTGTAAAQASNVSPLAMGAASLGLGGLLQALTAVKPLAAARESLRLNRRTVLIGALGIVVYPLAFYSSMRLGGVALGTVISLGTAPLFSGLLERSVDGARLGRRWYSAAFLGICGSSLLGFARASGEQADAAAVLASCLLGLAAGASYAVYSWATSRLMSAGIERRAAVGSVFGLGGLLLMPVLLAAGAPLLDSWQNLAVAAYLALVPMFLGYVLFGMALSKVSASTATTVTLSEPAVAAVLAMGLLGERLGLSGWLGMVLIAAALIALLLRSKSAQPADRELAQTLSG